MDSKRDIRPKLASRLLKDSLVLHCLFRVSLATQHIIGTIIFLKQRKTRIRITSSLNLRALGRYVVRMYERARVRSPCAPSPSLLTARPVAVTSGSPARDLPVALSDQIRLSNATDAFDDRTTPIGQTNMRKNLKRLEN